MLITCIEEEKKNVDKLLQIGTIHDNTGKF